MGRSGGGSGGGGGRSGNGGGGRSGGSTRQAGYDGGRGGGPGGPGGPPPRRHFFGGWHRGGGGCFGLGCGGMAAIVVIIAAVVGIIFSSIGGCARMGASANSVSYTSETSTTVREKLDESAVDETGWYTDEGDLIANTSTLEAGLEEFYEETGVQPYVYILESGSISSVSEASSTATELYDELFTDEGHFLLVFCETATASSSDTYDGYSDDYGTGESYTTETGYTVQASFVTVESSSYDYYYGYCIGEDAATVLDTEALEIFDEELSAAYYNYDLSYEEVFAQAFSYTAENIMSAGQKQQRTTIVTGVILVIVVVVAIVLLVIWRQRKKKEEDEERTRRADDVASKTYRSYDDEDVESRANKYE